MALSRTKGRDGTRVPTWAFDLGSRLLPATPRSRNMTIHTAVDMVILINKTNRQRLGGTVSIDPGMIHRRVGRMDQDRLARSNCMHASICTGGKSDNDSDGMMRILARL